MAGVLSYHDQRGEQGSGDSRRHAGICGNPGPVRNLIDCLEGGYTIDEFLEDFPTVSRDQVIAFLENTKAELELAVPA